MRKLSNFQEENKNQEQLELEVEKRIQKLKEVKLENFEHVYSFMKILEFILVKNYQNMIAIHIEDISEYF